MNANQKKPPPATAKKAPAASRPSTGAREQILLRNSWYRDGFRTNLTISLVLAIALLASVAANVVQANRKSEVVYFSTDSQGRVTPMVPLQEPFVTEPYLINWVAEAVSRAYSIDPQNYRRQVGDLQPLFTDDGYGQYITSIKDSGTLELIQKNLLVMSAVAQGAPVVVERGTVGGRAFWRLRVPMLVDFRSSAKSSRERRMVTVTVVRRSTLESPLGIGINQFVAAASAE